MTSNQRFSPKLPTLTPSEHTLTSIRGVRCAGVAAGIKASGRPDVALLVLDEPATYAAIFTRNALAAAPVQVSQRHQYTSKLVRAIVVNSGNANACTGEQGLADAKAMCAQVAEKVGCPVKEVLVCSTGVIGVPMPMDRVRRGIDAAWSALSDDLQAGRRFLQAIMTTDAFPKEASAKAILPPSDAGDPASPVITAGICKGAGMINPSMATMLAFVATDGAVDHNELALMIRRIAHRSFNAVHVDSHASTNDTFILLATGKAKEGQPLAPTTGQLDARTKAVEQTISDVSRRLAWLIARDGEGATKVTTIRVIGASDDDTAKRVAQHLAASALVRTALFGNDPNWGRFVSQVGNLGFRYVRCTLQGVLLFDQSEPVPFDRKALSQAMDTEDVSLEIDLTKNGYGYAPGQAMLMTSDLGYKYIEVNAEYTT